MKILFKNKIDTAHITAKRRLKNGMTICAVAHDEEYFDNYYIDVTIYNNGLERYWLSVDMETGFIVPEDLEKLDKDTRKQVITVMPELLHELQFYPQPPYQHVVYVVGGTNAVRKIVDGVDLEEEDVSVHLFRTPEEVVAFRAGIIASEGYSEVHYLDIEDVDKLYKSFKGEKND